jgi:hypothetical protein
VTTATLPPRGTRHYSARALLGCAPSGANCEFDQAIFFEAPDPAKPNFVAVERGRDNRWV